MDWEGGVCCEILWRMVYMHKIGWQSPGRSWASLGGYLIVSLEQ
jgi:hypothetical protein